MPAPPTPTRPNDRLPDDLDERIYAVIRQIPRGRVAAYGWIAERAGLVRGARRVGRALRQVPSSRRLPWHRVVNSQGKIALPAGSRSAQRQRQLLAAEGVEFSRGRIDLQRFGWRRSLDEILWADPWTLLG
jgi:methylated-DNA-protein-cysteine methyltransferase-like protein